MELLLSRQNKKRLSKTTMPDVLSKELPKTSILRIATGFITSDAIVEIKRIIELNRKPHLELFIGMHFLDSFKKSQFEAVKELNSFLLTQKLGHVFLSETEKFHGKMYSFADNKSPFAGLIGSSNLGSFLGTSNNHFEADGLFYDEASCKTIEDGIIQIVRDLGILFSEKKIKKFKNEGSLTEDCDSFERVTEANKTKIFAKGVDNAFVIALKTEPKSNLNAFFGKGRENKKTGFILPRPWYEVELIVPAEVTGSKKYPRNKTFKVFTPDALCFKCSTSGTNSKNFRSAGGLEVLGRWVKGTMEKQGALTIGQPVTEAVLEKFGYNSLVLSKRGNFWTLEFTNNLPGGGDK